MSLKAYKGFNRDMTCRGFQFKEGEAYELPEGQEAKLCKSGFHACEAPLDCFKYYEPGKSVYHEVELDATDETSDDSKRVGKRIRIGAQVDIAGIVKAQFEYVKSKCTNYKNGGDMSALNGGYMSALNGGNRSALNGGDRSALNGGYWSVIRGGAYSRFKGGMWAVFACEVLDDDKICDMKTAVVDGKAIKPDTWYTLKDGEFVEVGEDD